MKKGDIFVLLIAVILAFLWMITSHRGSVAAIYIDGELYKELPLSVNRELTIESEWGKNTIAIKDGQVKVIDSDCIGKECETGEISQTAHSIVCLPNRLSIIIEDKKAKEETDVIV